MQCIVPRESVNAPSLHCCRFRMQRPVIKSEWLTQWRQSSGCKSTTVDGWTAWKRFLCSSLCCFGFASFWHQTRQDVRLYTVSLSC